jgi:hypothetical protein
VCICAVANIKNAPFQGCCSDAMHLTRINFANRVFRSTAKNVRFRAIDADRLNGF